MYAKGPTNDEVYNIGDWVLVMHGRWTRGLTLDDGAGEKQVRMVENESILAYSDEKPGDVILGAEYSDGAHATVDPQHFVNEAGRAG